MESISLLEATRTDNIELLQNMFQENAPVAVDHDDFAFVSVSESLLHKATKAGNLSLFQELLKHNHELARDLNTDGFRALDIAVIMGNVAIAKEIIVGDPEICLLKGKDRKTALHHAASRGRIEVVDELASICRDCVKDTTVHGHTALHLAVKSYQFDAFKALIKWLEMYGMHEIINWRDHGGNTVLHLAASTKQYECLELLLKTSSIRQTVNLNGKNEHGLTALDVFDIVMETADDLHTRKILEQTGAVKATTASNNSSHDQQPPHAHNQQNTAVNHHGSRSSLEWMKYFYSQAQTDHSQTDIASMRNVLLLVAALFVTLSFQAGLQPPPPSVSDNKFFLFVFLFCMSVSFSASTNMVLYLTAGFPFQMELVMSMLAMAVSYGVASGGIGTGELPTVWSQIGNFLLSQALVLPLTLLWLPNYLKNAWEKRRGSSLPTRQ